jgi:hypothetical protein
LSLTNGTNNKGKGIPLDKLSLVVCDNVHEALRDAVAKTQLLKIFSIIRLI